MISHSNYKAKSRYIAFLALDAVDANERFIFQYFMSVSLFLFIVDFFVRRRIAMKTFPIAIHKLNSSDIGLTITANTSYRSFSGEEKCFLVFMHSFSHLVDRR